MQSNPNTPNDTHPSSNRVTLEEKQAVIRALKRLAVTLEGDRLLLRQRAEKEHEAIFVSQTAGSFEPAIGGESMRIILPLMWAHGISGENGAPGPLTRWSDELLDENGGRRASPLSPGHLHEVDEAWCLVKQLEDSGNGGWFAAPPNCVTRLRSMADRLEEVIAEVHSATLVTLSQAAALAGMSPRTLARHVTSGRLPRADHPGTGGRASKWIWTTLRPDLERVCHRTLPCRFPESRIFDA